MNRQHPHDLSQVRPSAELDHPGARRRRPPPGAKRRRQRPRKRRKTGGVLRNVFAGFAVFVVLLAAVVAGFLFLASPTELVRNEIIRQVKVNTGRDLTIAGASRFIFYPSIGVSLGKVTLSGPPEMRDRSLLEAERIELSVALLPLLSRQVLIEHVGLIRPIVNLHVDRQGRQSWDFAALRGRKIRFAAMGQRLAAPATRTDTGPDDVFAGAVIRASLPTAATVAAALPPYLKQLELRSISLSKARINYSDVRSGTQQHLRDLDLRLIGRRISDPLRATGGVVWRGQNLKFSARLTTLEAMLSERPAKAHVTVSGKPFSAGFEGTVKISPKLELAGETRIDGQSVAGAARWLGTALPNAKPIGGFSVTGRMTASPDAVTLKGARLALGDTKASGTVKMQMRAKRPYVSANLKVTDIDVDRLSVAFSEAQAVAPKAAAGSSGNKRPAAGGKSPTSIEDLLRRSQVPGDERPTGVGRFAPQVRGYRNRNEWSAEPIDAAALGLVDGDAKLQIDGLKISGLAIGKSALRLALAKELLRVDIDSIKLYNGAGKGVITVKPARAGGVAIGTNINVTNVSARPLLKDAADFERLAGQGDLTLIASARGKSQKAIASNLAGEARLVFKDGAIVGWNIAKMIRGAQRGQFSNFEAVASEQTDFSELSASFKIVKGVATTNDLAMNSPLLRLAGNGDVGIGRRNLDLALRPKLVSSLAGQGGRQDAAGIVIPFKVTGPWHAPRLAPDLSGLARDPGQLLDKAQELGRQLKGRNVGDLVRGVLGQNGGAAGDATQESSEPQNVIKRLWQ